MISSIEKQKNAIKRKIDKRKEIIGNLKTEIDQLETELAELTAYAKRNEKGLEVFENQLLSSGLEMSDDNIAAVLEFLKQKSGQGEQVKKEPEEKAPVKESKKETTKAEQPNKDEERKEDAPQGKQEEDHGEPQLVDVSVSTPTGVSGNPDDKPSEENGSQLWSPASVF